MVLDGFDSLHPLQLSLFVFNHLRKQQWVHATPAWHLYDKEDIQAEVLPDHVMHGCAESSTRETERLATLVDS